MKLRPSYLIATEFSATGGVLYKREEVDSPSEKTKSIQIVTKSDNPDLHKEAKSILGLAYYTMDKLSVPTPMGYAADEKSLGEIEFEFGAIKDAAATFNQLAAALKSARRMRVDIYPIPTPLDNVRVVERLRLLVLERLQDLRDTLFTGNKKSFQYAWMKAASLEKLVQPPHQAIVGRAVGLAKEFNRELTNIIKKGNDRERAGELLQLDPLDKCINSIKESL